MTDSAVKQNAQPRWPPGDGEMARLIRGHDWAKTSLGPAENWPARLCLAIEIMLESAFPTYVWWGPERIQLYNDAAIRVNRFNHPRVFAIPARHCWEESWDTLGVLAERAIAGGTKASGEDLPLVTDPSGTGEPAWFTISISPLRAAEGEAAGVFITMIETTRRIRAETRLRVSEVRTHKMFQQAPGVVLVLRGPDHVFEFINDASAKLIGGRDRAGRSVRDVDLGVGNPDFVELLDRAFRTGERTEAFGMPIELQSRAGLPIERRFLDVVAVPVTDFVGAVTGTFVTGLDATDRVRAQRLLRESEERQAYLLALSDALRPIADPVEVQAVAARLVGEHLGVSRAFYCDVEHEADGAWFIVLRDYHVPDVPSTVGRFRASDFGVLVQEVLAGRSIAVCDVCEESELSEDELAAYLKVGARAWCAVPLIKNGVNVAVLCVHEIGAREWEDHEMTLLEETAERTWAAVERARAETALRQSETRLRLARARLEATLEAGLAGTFYWDIEQDRVVVDEHLQRYFSLSQRALTDGVPLSEVMPAIFDEDRGYVTEALREAIERTAVYAVEYRVHHADGDTRWLSARGRVEHNSAGLAVALPGFVVDITRIKEAETVLRAGARC